MYWIIGVGLLVAVGYFLDREIYFYEGVHLGPRLQAWLYDRWSKKYDEGKRASQLRDDEMLAVPLLNALGDIPAPFILDFATGTGRLSYALLKQGEFKGHIVAVDLSQGMLAQAAAKLGGVSTTRHENTPSPLTAPVLPGGARAVPAAFESTKKLQVEFLRHLSLPLPFPDAAFDAVCALEVLELFPNMDEPLAELKRVLRPGGVLLSSRGTEESGRKAKVKSPGAFAALLKKQGLEQIEITKWWKLFDRVIAVKHGSSPPVSFTELSDILKCAACNFMEWVKSDDHWECGNCGRKVNLTREDIVLN